MTKLVNRGKAASGRGGGGGDRGGNRGGDRGGRIGGRGGGVKGGPPGGGVGKKSQPSRQGPSSGWKDEFREAFKWKGRAGKAVKARTQVVHPAMKPLSKGRELTPDEVRKLIQPVLQPVRAKYGGQGFARPSVFVDISSENVNEIIKQLYDERVEGFSGKSYKKLGNAQDMMEWRQRLKDKVEREGGGKGRNDAYTNDGKNKKKSEDEYVEKVFTQPTNSTGTLSRKQKKKAAQMGLSSHAMLALQTSKVKVEVDDGLRNNAIEAYRAMQRAKLKGTKR